MGDYDELEGHDPVAEEEIDEGPAGKVKDRKAAESDSKPSKPGD
jgi:hypothetical protein